MKSWVILQQVGVPVSGCQSTGTWLLRCSGWFLVCCYEVAKLWSHLPLWNHFKRNPCDREFRRWRKISPCRFRLCLCWQWKFATLTNRRHAWFESDFCVWAVLYIHWYTIDSWAHLKSMRFYKLLYHLPGENHQITLKAHLSSANQTIWHIIHTAIKVLLLCSGLLNTLYVQSKAIGKPG